MRAVVVGAGIGGVATAAGLARRGWSVTLLERQPVLGEAGASLALWPNAVRALRFLGAADTVEAEGMAIEGGGSRTDTGRWLTRLDARRMTERLGAPALVVHRTDLHAALVAALPKSVTVRTGVTVTGVDELDADLLVGADGIGSTIRQAHAPEVTIRDSGQVGWRAMVPQTAAAPLLPQVGESLGRGWRFGCTSVGSRGVYWYAAAPGPLRSGTPVEQLAELRAVFASWHDPIPALVAATNPADLHHHPLLDLDPVAPMRFGERIALVGDAAHAMTPNLGQGACQALEDAATLAALLDPAFGLPLAQALVRYDALRRPRVARIVAQSRRLGRIAGSRGRLACALRNLAMTAVPARVAESSAAALADWTPPTH
jgi:2-polyprenyl-6-methoxyphenol hydroxylase-like FAD-dependent oxidoreductase